MRNTVNEKYSDRVSELSRKMLRECIGQEFTLMGYIYKEYDDGIRVLLVTDEGYLLRIPKWYSFEFINCSDEELEWIKSGKLKITNIRKENTNGNYYTYKFDIVYKGKAKTTLQVDSFALPGFTEFEF